ncbi:MAG: ribonuclease Y [Planctomycetota bacterium]|nr:MAG: ribonuclease Y [Planctomycetota bacterium]
MAHALAGAGGTRRVVLCQEVCVSILLQSNSGDFGIAAILGAAVIALVVGAVVGIVILNFASGRGIKSARAEADRVLADAKAQAALAADAVRSDGERKAREIELAAEKSASEKRTALERDSRATQIKLDETLSRATKREETLDRKLESIDAREKRIDAREADLKRQDEEAKRVNEENERTRTELRGALSKLSGLTQEQARELYMTEVREQADHDAAGLRQKILDEATRDAKSKAREITLMSIQRYAAENVGESTVRSIKITSEDMKGRIIGREGRNIRAIEKATGADILVDDTPGVISVSCFDRVRQAIAAEALQRLVADGRIHPTRIEELVEQTKRDIEERIVKVGNEAIVEADVRGVHPKIVEALGKMHFRTSYGQNVLRHSIEVAFLAQMIADQLGLNGAIARRAGLLHDIGKAMDHEMEGGHPAIGMEFLRKFGEKSEAVLNACGGHHGDIPSTTAYTPIIMAADAISGARPGARRESMELYIKRLEQLEAIAREQPFVDEAHAIQAGREIRVILNAKKADDTQAFQIAEAIARRVEAEMTFPGEIKVTVLRETRAEAIAR